MKRQLCSVMAAVIVSFGLVHGVAASDEYVQDFRSQIQLSQNNTATITERIVYNFGEHQRHGIYREIPTRSFVNEEEGFELDFNLRSASYEGDGNTNSQVTRQDGQARIEIRSTDQTITGEHTYVIKYTLSPIAFSGSDGDIFRFDIPGEDWDVPLRNVSARLSIPASIKNVHCYTGEPGENENTGMCSSSNQEQRANYQITENLAPGEVLTVEATMPQQSLDQYPEIMSMERGDDGLSQFTKVVLGLAGLGVLVIILKSIWSYIRYRLRRARQTIIPRYEPPEGLKPAEVGFLHDNSSDTTEFTATLIDVAVRGYITIEQETTDRFILSDKKTYTLHKQRAFDELDDYERNVLEPLFGGADTVRMEDADPKKMQGALKRMHQNLTDRLEESGFYRGSGKKTIQLNQPTAVIVVGAIIFVIIMFVNPILLFALLLIPIVYVVWKYGSLHARITEQGLSAWARVEGFRQFLSVTQKERFAFHDAPDRNPEQFSEYLPYAVALGVEQEWAQQFEDIDVTPGQNWYGGSDMGAVSASAIASDIAGGIQSSAQSNFADNSSSSGGSSAGGGAGGGGGGSL